MQEHDNAESAHCFCRTCNVIIYSCWTTRWYADGTAQPRRDNLDEQRQEHTKKSGHTGYTATCYMRDGKPQTEEDY